MTVLESIEFEMSSLFASEIVPTFHGWETYGCVFGHSDTLDCENRWTNSDQIKLFFQIKCCFFPMEIRHKKTNIQF